MSARTVLVCNACGAVDGLTPPDDTNTTRRTLKAKGWGHWKRGVDYCPECLPAVLAKHKVINSMGYV